MATEAQITANRQNAKKSTGPRTANGKRKASKNAVTHGLFGREVTIHGENEEEYDRHREAFLDELRPVGMCESVLAERIVTLSWRLKRAERMENQATDMLIIRCGGEVPDTAMVLAIPHEIRRIMIDAETLGRDLSLGQAVIRDFSYFRVIEKVTLYARRMENNLIKTMKELKKLQLMRIIEQAEAAKQQSTEVRRVAATERTLVSEVDGVGQDNVDSRHPLHSLRSFSGCHTTAEQQSAEESAPAEINGSELKKRTQSPASGRKSEARNSKCETGAAQDHQGELKKQTQYAPTQMRATPSARKDYDDMPAAGMCKNKAERSQFHPQGEPARLSKSGKTRARSG